MRPPEMIRSAGSCDEQEKQTATPNNPKQSTKAFREQFCINKPFLSKKARD
jgi:hypothetical protein